MRLTNKAYNSPPPSYSGVCCYSTPTLPTQFSVQQKVTDKATFPLTTQCSSRATATGRLCWLLSCNTFGLSPTSGHYTAFHRLRATADSSWARFDGEYVITCGADDVACASGAYALVYRSLHPRDVAEAFLAPCVIVPAPVAQATWVVPPVAPRAGRSPPF